MIINIEPGTFGGPCRAGDLIGVANAVEHLRQVNNNVNIKFHMKQGTIDTQKHCREFFSWLTSMTDYFSETVGSTSLPWRKVNLFDFRDISGDLVKISNPSVMEKKIVIFPLFDAPYNIWRNWPKYVFDSILDSFEKEEYADYEKIVCCKEEIERRPNWKYSFDFLTNVNHIMTSEVFVGGDTFSSHIAGTLDRGPKTILYYYSSRSLIHALPFNFYNGRGTLKRYWLDFENTKWD